MIFVMCPEEINVNRTTSTIELGSAAYTVTCTVPCVVEWFDEVAETAIDIDAIGGKVGVSVDRCSSATAVAGLDIKFKEGKFETTPMN